MKKLFVTIFLSSVLLSSVSYGAGLNGFFGITLNDNAEDYVSSTFIESNKGKHRETLDGYFYLIITDEIENKSPYATYYEIVIDSNNIIHSIIGTSELLNLDVCKAVLESVIDSLEERHQIEFDYFEQPYPEFKIYSYFHYNNNLENYLAVQCNEVYGESKVNLQIYTNTFEIADAIDKFYDSGL